MTEHTLTNTHLRRAAGRRDPWWIPLGEAIAALFSSPRPGSEAAAADLPPQVLRDHDPALHRALNGHSPRLDVGARPMLY